MSMDTMECGCLSHADYEYLCKYPKLLAERDELKMALQDLWWKLEEKIQDANARYEKNRREKDDVSKMKVAESLYVMHELGNLAFFSANVPELIK